MGKTVSGESGVSRLHGVSAINAMTVPYIIIHDAGFACRKRPAHKFAGKSWTRSWRSR